jgi:phosphatidate phosphatase APP1
MIALIGLGMDKPIAEGSQKYYSKLANKEFISNPSKNIWNYLQELKVENQAFGTIFDSHYGSMMK